MKNRLKDRIIFFRMPIPLLLMLNAIALSAVVGIVLIIAGQSAAGGIVANLGTVVAMLATMLYVVFFDSKKRWPKAAALQRFINVITFQR